MSIKGLARAAWRQWRQDLPQPELVRMFYPRGIVFVHVPKCGGSSVEEGLRKAYRYSRFRVDSERSAAGVRATLGQVAPVRDTLIGASIMRSHVLHYALACGYACITGHAPLRPGMMEAYDASHAFVTILRDPVERFKSHYAFSHGSGKSGHIEEDLEAFLDTPRATDIGQLYLKYFGLVETGSAFDTARAVEAAKQTLDQMSAIGFLDRMDGFAEALGAIRGRPVNIGHANKGTARRKDRVEFSPAVVARIEAICAPDIEIYNWARARFGGAA